MNQSPVFLNTIAQSLNPNVETLTAPKTQAGLDLNTLDLEFLIEIFRQIIHSLNLFSLTFSIFLIYIFLAGFFQHRIINTRKGKGPIEKKGVKCINRAISTSLRQILIVVLYVIWSIFSVEIFDIIINLLLILAFLVKLRFDFVEILEDLKYFKWLEGYRQGLLKMMGVKK